MNEENKVKTEENIEPREVSVDDLLPVLKEMIARIELLEEAFYNHEHNNQGNIVFRRKTI